MSRWVRLVAAVVAMIQIANLQYAWTLFVQPLRDAHGWSLSDVQWGLTVFIALETWAMPPAGLMIERFSKRMMITVAGLMCAAGWAGLGFVTSLPGLYLSYAVAGIGAAIVYCGSIGVALKWFPDRRGLAAGLIAAGFGSGSALFTPFLPGLIASWGYQMTFVATGLLQGMLIIASSHFISGEGAVAPAVVAPKAAAAKKVFRKQTQDFTPGEMLRTMQFYWLYAMMLMMGIGGLLATAQVAPVGRSFGIPAEFITLSVTVNAIANGSGRFFWGMVSDRLGREQTMVIAFLIQSASLVGVMTLGPTSGVMFMTMMALVFFTWGEVYSLFPSALADFYGGNNAGGKYGFLYSTKGVASIVAAGLAAKLFESTGSWGPAFYGSAALALVSAGMALGLMRIPLPSKKDLPATAATA